MKVSKKLTSAVLLAVMGTSQLTYAEPTLYPENLTILGNIQNSTDSSILADEASPNTVWVLPPSTGKAYVEGLHTKTANMGFCAEMRDLQTYSRSDLKDIEALEKKRNARSEEIVKLQRAADGLDQEAEKYAAEKNLMALVNMDSRLQDFEQRLTDLYDKAENCKTTCDEIAQEIRDTTASKKTLIRDRNNIARDNAEDVRVYTKKRRAADAARKNVKSISQVYQDMITEIWALKDMYQARYQSLGSMEGARSALSYVSHWNQNVDQLRQENGGLNFAKIATKKVKLMTESAGVAGIDGKSAIMSIDVAGGTPVNGVYELTGYPESFSSNVRLSLVGACPLEHPEYFDLKENDVQKMKYGVIVAYEFDSIFSAKATVTYNMLKIYEKIVRSGSSGGLFSSRSWSSVEEHNFFKDSLDVTWDDKENTFTQEQKDARSSEMRAAVLGRLATLALPNVPQRAELLATAAPPTHGAVVISNELMKSCPGNAYCVAGAAVARILDAIFGSSSSTSSYKSIISSDQTETYTQKSKISKPLVTSYL